jgi:mRNA interferase HigB
MKIHLIRKETVAAFVLNNVQSRRPFEEWLIKVKYADWEMPADILDTFPNADLLGGGSARVVFNISGNNYRAICKYIFGDKQMHLFICWLGTHAEYDEFCKMNKQFTVNLY